MKHAGNPAAATSTLLWPVFAISCGILGYEIVLMRVLLYASWHHFAFLVISVALLGFGASGTVLCFLRRWLLERSEAALFVLVVATAVSMPVSIQLARHIPVEARFVPALLAKQVSLWVLYWAVHSVPFLLGATAIGLALMRASDRLATVYAVNLAGSALGAMLATAAMHFFAPGWLAALCGGTTMLGAFPRVLTRRRRRVPLLAAAVLTLGGWLALDPPQIRIDPYKYLSYVHRLRAGGRAARLAAAYGPRAVVEAFEGGAFHDLPFLGVGEDPPPMIALVVDGHGAGSLLRVQDADAARVVDGTLMSVPYALLRRRPRVLLLGESGGANVWLAARNDAERIEVVQPDAKLIDLVRNRLRDQGGLVLEQPAVGVVNEEPRHFVEHTRNEYDLIQLVSMESWAVETGGVGGLSQDYLITVEGLASCLERLSPDGILAVGRGIQLPPRDHPKLVNTFVHSLRRLGVDRPKEHIVVLRDYLAACTMVKRSPWTPDDIERVRRLCARRELTPVYFDGIRADELNRPDRLPGPPGEAGDWLHHATEALLSGRAGEFVERWAFDIRPPTDDRPFYGNFTRLRAIGALKVAFGDLWLTRTELALLFVLVALGIIGAVGLALTIVPLALVSGIRRARGLGPTAVYFTAIGLAYLMVEITALSRLIRLIGDPVQAGAAAIAGFLFFSGTGSLVAHRIGVPAAATLRRIVLGLLLVGIMEAWLVGAVTSIASSWPAGLRLAASVLLIAPLGFLMGFPMPSALRRLEAARPALVPWAWGVNGFASVLAPPLATAVGMTVGFRAAGASALLLYLVAAAAFGRLPTPSVSVREDH